MGWDVKLQQLLLDEEARAGGLQGSSGEWCRERLQQLHCFFKT
jgi:hypothetical protein